MAGLHGQATREALMPKEERTASSGAANSAETQSLVIDSGRTMFGRSSRTRLLKLAAALGVGSLVLAACALKQAISVSRASATTGIIGEHEKKPKPFMYQGPMPKCSKKGTNCILTGCCTSGDLCVVTKLTRGGVPSHATCKAKPGDGEFEFTLSYPEVNGVGDKTWKEDGRTCHSRFVAPEANLRPDKHNGVSLPDVCIKGTDEHHIFVIADWGGKVTEFGIEPADVTKVGGWRKMVPGVDDEAQELVAEQMQERAAKKKPDYIINAGNSFWGGVSTHCGPPPFLRANTGQWKALFEDVYKGEGLDGKQWLGVLGHQDYGGSSYVAGWDQTIGYTWGGPGSTGRWMMPAQYYMATVRYTGFYVEYYFMDSSNWEKGDMCKADTNGPTDHCGPAGPPSAGACNAYFDKLFKQQTHWLDNLLKKSNADWQIVVTSTPPWMGIWNWVHLARTHGIDLIISGNKHNEEVHNIHDKFYIINDGWGNLYSDFLASTAWIVSGGGGGATSAKSPESSGGKVQYGFMDLTLSNSQIKVEIVSHTGEVRDTSIVRKRIAAVPYPFYNGQLTPEERERDKPLKSGCPRKQTFYAYRVQDEKTYDDENINAASLAGALWYMHHEVVIVCPRKFGMTRIRRLKVTMQNSCDLYEETKTNFGPYHAYDSGMCHVDSCKSDYRKYGYTVGCQHIPFNKGIFAAYCDNPHTACRYPHWYSFPGKCPSMDFRHKDAPVCKHESGGQCKNVTGERDCTYNIEDAGELKFDELYESTGPSHNWAQFCASKKEYNNETDKGEGVSFWDGIYSPHKCIERYDKIQQKFKEKYPHMPMELDQPHCDFFKSDPIGNFLYNTGSGYSRSADRTGYAR